MNTRICKWAAGLLMVGALQVGTVNADAAATSQELSEELAAAIAEIEASFQDMDERVQRIALLIANTTRTNPQGSAPVLAALSRGLSLSDLPVVSAAAVMSAGTQSPAVLKAMLAAQEEDTSRMEAIRTSATHPTQVLGTRTAALMQPVELVPLSQPVAKPVEVVAPPVTIAAAPAAREIVQPPAQVPVQPTATVIASVSPEPVVPTAPIAEETETVEVVETASLEPVPPPFQQSMQPPPSQPPGLPPRPPAAPYRGQ